MKRLQKLALAMFCVFALGHAQAATFNINLNGAVSDGVFSSFDAGGLHYDYWQLGLSSLDLPITVSIGDTVNATITLDQSITMPASGTYSYFDLTLTGTLSPAETETGGTTTFFNNGVQGWSGIQGTTTTGQLSHSFISFPPNNGAITFDKITSNFDIIQLDTSVASVALDDAPIYYLRVTAIPEPETYAMLFAGLWLIGAAVCRRKA